jgi:hypothetical protein
MLATGGQVEQGSIDFLRHDALKEGALLCIYRQMSARIN